MYVLGINLFSDVNMLPADDIISNNTFGNSPIVRTTVIRLIMLIRRCVCNRNDRISSAVLVTELASIYNNCVTLGFRRRIITRLNVNNFNNCYRIRRSYIRRILSSLSYVGIVIDTMSIIRHYGNQITIFSNNFNISLSEENMVTYNYRCCICRGIFMMDVKFLCKVCKGVTCIKCIDRLYICDYMKIVLVCIRCF